MRLNCSFYQLCEQSAGWPRLVESLADTKDFLDPQWVLPPCHWLASPCIFHTWFSTDLVTTRHMTSDGSRRLILSVRRVAASHSRSVLSAEPDTSRCCCGGFLLSGAGPAAGTNATAVTLQP